MPSALDRVDARFAESRASGAAEHRAIGGVPWRPWDDPYWRFDVGGPVHPSKAIGSYGGVEAALMLQPVYSSVRILADGVAQIPIRQYREESDGFGGFDLIRMPLGQLLRNPSAVLNVYDWHFQWVMSAALQGTAWGYITQRDAYGYPITVEWLPDEMMQVVDPRPYNPAKVQIFFAGKPVKMSDLLIIRAFTVPGRTKGIAPLQAFQMLIESGLNAMEYGRGWFKHGGTPPGVFKNTEYEIDDIQSDKVRKKLVRAQIHHEPLVIGRDWDYTAINIPPDQAQFIQTIQMNATQVAGVFGVPPYRVGGSRGDSLTYSTVESDALSLITDTLDPWLVRFETAMATCLPGQQVAHFWRDARLRNTPDARWTMYQTARNIGGMNPNEIRKREGLPPIPKPKDPAKDYDGDDYTPLQIQVAAAKKSGELLQGEDTAAAPAPGLPPAKTMPPTKPLPVPAAAPNGNGSSNGNGSG